MSGSGNGNGNDDLILRACADACIGPDGEPITPLEAACLRAHADAKVKDRCSQAYRRRIRASYLRARNAEQLSACIRAATSATVRETSCDICLKKMFAVPTSVCVCFECHAHFPHGSYDLTTRISQIAQLLARRGYSVATTSLCDSLLLYVGQWLIFASPAFIIDEPFSIDAQLCCIAVQFPTRAFRYTDAFVRVAQQFANLARRIEAMSGTLTIDEQAQFIQQLG